MSKTHSVIEVPTVHLNGTSGEEMRAQVEAACRAGKEFLRSLVDAAPNARDYYVAGPDAFRRAQDEYRDRLNRTDAVVSELERVLEGIQEQLDRAHEYSGRKP